MRYGNNSINNNLASCGYGSCPCRGVNFISGDGRYMDFCINGVRVHTWNYEVPAPVFLFELDKYAEYLQMHATGRFYDQPLEPFAFTLREWFAREQSA